VLPNVFRGLGTDAEDLLQRATMFVLVPLEHPGVQAGCRGVIVVEDLLDFSQGDAQFVEGVGGGVPDHMRFAGAQVPGTDLFDGLDRELCAAAAVVGKRHPDWVLLLLRPVRAIESLQVIVQRTGRLYLQQLLIGFRALRPREADLEPIADPGEIANMHRRERPAALRRLQRHTEQRIVAFARVVAAIDPGQEFAHVEHLDGLCAGVGVDGAALDVIDVIVAGVEALLFSVLEQAGDGGQPVVIGRGRDLAFVLRGRGAAARPLLDDQEVAGEEPVIGELHQEIVAVLLQPGAQRDRRRVIGDVRFPTL